MPAKSPLDPTLRAELVAIYEEIMWLARRPNVAPSKARAWYRLVMSGRSVLRLRRFTGKVSRSAAEQPGAILRLEHFKRIQTTLSSLVERHKALRKPNAEEFIDVLLRCERVHIVTFAENYAAMRAKGRYRNAGIELLNWRDLPAERQATLWKTMLRGRVANAAAYAPRLQLQGKGGRPAPDRATRST